MQASPKPAILRLTAFVLPFALAYSWLSYWPLGAQEDSNPSSQTEPPQEPALSPPAIPEETPSAKKVFEQAREKLRSRLYRAKIVQRFAFPSKTLEATGSMVRGPKYQMRLHFVMKSGSTEGELLQVCNGDQLWTQRRVNNVTRLTVQDVKEILNKTSQSQENLVIAELGLGGVTSLLASIDRSMNFGDPQPVEIDGEPLMKLEGEWNAAFQQRILGNEQLAKGLPEYIPDGARIYFDRDDFPRRIQYLKKEGKTDIRRALITIDFLDVEWLAETDLDPKLFEYTPPERVYPEDVTKIYTDLLTPRPAAAPPK